jgi:TRAP-type C4-dicarboxylate transport system substrate-binding protein
MRNTFLKGAIALAAGLALSTPALAQTKWDMPTPYPENNFHTINIKQFADDVRKATGNKLDIKVHSAGSLIGMKEIKNAVRGGQVPIGEFIISILSNENPLYEIDSLPFLASSYPEAKRLWEASKPATVKMLDRENLKVLFSVPWPPQDLWAKKEIKSTEDLRGLKFRTYNPTTTRMAQLAGAIPTQIESKEIAQAFATGRVDSMFTSSSFGVSIKAADYLSHLYKVHGWLPKNIVVVNKRSFAALDKNVQAALVREGQKAEARGWKMSEEDTAKSLKALAAAGMVVADPSPQLSKGLKQIGATLAEEWAKNAGKEGKAALEAYRKP